MKVGIYCPELYPGGEVAFVKSLADALSDIGFVEEVTVYTSCEDIISSGNIRVKNINPIFPRFSKGHCSYLKLYRSFLPYQLLEAFPVDVVVAPYLTIDLLLIGNRFILNPQDLRRRYVVHKWYDAKYRVNEFFLRKVFERASRIVVDSSYNERDVSRFYGVPVEKIDIIHSMPDINAIEGCQDDIAVPAKLKENGLDPGGYFYYPAHLIDQKNHFNLLKALNIIKNRYGQVCPLILTGGRKDKLDSIEKAALEYGIDVRYLGYVPYADVLMLLKNSRALVFASLFDPYALPIWEAFFLKVPVVSSNVCGLPEQVSGAGLLFNPEDPVDMAEKMFTIWEDDSLRNDLIVKGESRIKGFTDGYYATKLKFTLEGVK